MKNATVLVGVAALWLSLAPQRLAHANGRPIRTVSVHVRPGHPNDIIVAATIGMNISHDGGATWRWMCEDAIGYSGMWDPDYEYSETGRIFATTFDGLQVLSDNGCGFEIGPTGATFFSRVAMSSSGVLLAAATDLTDSRIYRSDDDGETFPIKVSLGANGDWWQSLEFAPSDPNRVYLTGYHLEQGLEREHKFFRSDDAGMTFQALSVDAFLTDANSSLEIAAISPSNPDLLLMRVDQYDGSIGDAIYVSNDAGVSWVRKLELDDATPGIAIRPDGKIYVTQTTRTLPSYVSTDNGVTFTELVRSDPTDVYCLGNLLDGRMYVCAHFAAPDSMAMGVGQDFETLTEQFNFSELAGPIRCDDGTKQKDVCEDQIWCGLKTMYAIASNEISCQFVIPPDANPGDDDGGDSGGPGCCQSSNTAPVGALGLALLTAMTLLRRRRPKN